MNNTNIKLRMRWIGQSLNRFYYYFHKQQHYFLCHDIWKKHGNQI